jgi:hypothetical protein
MVGEDRESQERAPRLKVFQPAEMLCGAFFERVHLLNLSATGALIHGDTPPAEGTKIRLLCGFPLGEARVAWTKGKYFGVAFDRALPDIQLDTILNAGSELVENLRRPPVARRQAG